MNERVLAKRRAKAVAILICLFAVGVVVSIIDGSVAEAARAAPPGEGLIASELVDGADPFASLERLERAGAVSSVEMPAYFKDEIGCIKESRDVRVSADESIVGYLVDKAAQETMELVRTHMEERGWAEVPLGKLDGATFVKEEGKCTWTLVTCVDTGSGTSVVHRSLLL